MKRLLDPVPLAEALRRPDVAPLVRGFDPEGWIADRSNVALVEDGDMALFERKGPHAYEGHVLFESRGREALKLGRAMIAAMVDMYGARAIYGQTPFACPQARWFSRRLGFRSVGTVERPMGRCELFILERPQ